MDDVVELGLEAFQGPVLDHHDKVTQPLKRAGRKLTGREEREQDDGNRGQDQDNSQRHNGRQDQYQQRDRYNQQGRRGQQGRNHDALPLGGRARRPGMGNRRTSSLDRGRFAGGAGAAAGYGYGQGQSRVHQKDNYYDSNSSSSISSRDRRLRRRRTEGGANVRRSKSDRQGRSDSSSSSSTSMDDIAPAEDEKKARKMKGKEMLTAGLAAIATIHAGAKVYQASTATHERHEAVRKGKMTQEEADKKKHLYRFQEFASLGIAALGVKGVYDEWKGVQGQHQETEKTEQMRDRHREKLQDHHRQRSRHSSSHGDYRRSNSEMRRR